MNLNIVRYCTILIIVIRPLDVVTCSPTASPKLNRNNVAFQNRNNNNFVPSAQPTNQENSFAVSDSDEEIELDTTNLNNSAIGVTPIPGRTPVAGATAVRATNPRATTISLPETDNEGPSSMPRPVGAAPRPIAVGAQPVARAAQPIPVGAQPQPRAAQPIAVGAQPQPRAAQPIPVGAQPQPRAAQPIAVSPQVVAAPRPRMPVAGAAAAPRGQSISLADSDFEGPSSMPRPAGAAARPMAVGAQPIAAGAQPMAAGPRAVPVAAQPGGLPVGAPKPKSQGISLADSDFEGPSKMPRPAGAATAVAAQPMAAGARPVAVAAKPAGVPVGPPRKSQGISLADSDFEGPSSMPRPGGAPPTKVMVSGQAPGSSSRSNFEDIPLSDIEDSSSKKSSKFEDIPLSEAEDFGKPGGSRPLGRPPKAKSAGGFEDIALSDTEGFDPIGPGPGARAAPRSGQGSSGASRDFEDVQIDGFSDFGGSGPRGPPKTRGRTSKMEDIVLSDAGEFEDILVETDTEGAPKAPRRVAAFGAAAKGPMKAGGTGSIYEVKVQDSVPDAKEAPRPAPKMQPRQAYVESLKLVVDVSKKWSTDELEYRRNDSRRMDVFTAVHPHLIYKVKNFDDTLWEAKNEAYVKMVEIETRENKPPLVTVYLPDELYPTGEAAAAPGFAVEEEQMSDFSDYSKFAVRHKRMSEAATRGPEGEIKVTEVRPGGYDSDASIIETRRPKKRHRPGLLVHLVMLDIKNKLSSDKITYERQGEFDVFTAVEPYLIDKVQKRNQLIWQSTNMNYASRVIQKKTGNKRNFRIFFPYCTAQCSDSGSDDERIRREVDEHFKQAQLEANYLAKMQAAQAAQMFAPPVPHSPFQPFYPAPPHVPPAQYYRPQGLHYAPHHAGVAPDPFITVQDRYETYTSQPKRRYMPSHHSVHAESPTDRLSDPRKQRPREPEAHHDRHVGRRDDADPNVEIVELYKVEERELHEESEPESPDFAKHIILDVEVKKTTDKVLYEENADNTVAFTAKDPYLFGVAKKGERILWTSKDGRYSKRIVMRERDNDIPLLRVFLPRLKPPMSRASQPRRVELDVNYRFSTNEYDFREYFDRFPQRVTKHTYTTKGGNKFNVVRRSDHVIWRARDDNELSDQVVVLKYHDINTEQVMINLPDGSARKYTKPQRCVNYYRNWADMGSVPLFSPATMSVALDISNKYDTHYYQYLRMGDVSTFTARYGFVFTAVLDRKYVVWSSTGSEFAVSVEVVGEYDMTIQLCTTNKRFAKAENDVWFEYTEKLEATPIYVPSSQYLV
ncbi:hypothetical protein MACJ_002285 [Theileria orientalis]|uniref:Uncharacterized protein n=1 Tax=Theileria orientalis TaxID=68886 RepID=A0A976QVE1_THEOR|nr:hypothetical protein MACJ_002285 [Theileria orientalis]